MPSKGPQVRSPAQPIYLHPVLSVATLALVGGGLAAYVQMFGDPGAAGPRAIVKLAAAPAGPLHAPLADVVVDPALDAPAGDPNSGVEVHTVSEAPSAHPVDPLPPAPLPGLSQPGPNGPLPVVGAGGQTSFKAYRRPFKPDPKKAKIAVIVGGLGFNAAATDQAIADLPADVTLSFVPYAQNLQSWIDKARAAGHEVIVELPMEPFDVDEDTGPQTLLAGLDPKSNVSRLEFLLGRAVGYFAVMNYQGAKSSASQSAAPPVVKALKERGLGMVGNGLGLRSALGAEAVGPELYLLNRNRVGEAGAERTSILQGESLQIEQLIVDRGGVAADVEHAIG